ncbi:hypothetical protein LBMAG21_11900 [Armatimonadota bacterium]|nr:hypothetical protein LBMAG21_11900 [Armatimonadota bacterium]
MCLVVDIIFDTIVHQKPNVHQQSALKTPENSEKRAKNQDSRTEDDK